MVNSNQENHSSLGSRSERKMPKSPNETRRAGDQEQYLFFHMMTVQLKETNTAIIRQQRIFCVWAEIALSSRGYWVQRSNSAVY